MPVLTPYSFPSVTECRLVYVAAMPSKFPRGAAPRLKLLLFTLPAMWASRGDFDLGLGHFPSLENVEVLLMEEGATRAEVKKAHAALSAACCDHPNRPKLLIYIVMKSLGMGNMR